MSGILDIPQAIEQSELFSGISRDYMRMICGIANIYRYSFGDVIIEQGTTSSELYIIAAGEVDIQVDQAMIGDPMASGLVRIATLRRGETFGEIAIIDDGVRSATATSGSSDTHLVSISRDALLEMCHDHPKLGFQLMRNMAINLAKTLRDRTTEFQLRELLSL
jgi:CRP/FNR family cyclic AMP-dependent transcriptional regulator